MPHAITKGRFRVAFLALMPLAACQCDDNLAALDGRVAGRLCDPATGFGLSNAPLTLRDSVGQALGATSDGEGYFVFEEVATGPATLLAEDATGAREVS